MFCPSQIKNYIITGLLSNFLMHIVRGWNFFCRKENTISLVRYINLWCFLFCKEDVTLLQGILNKLLTNPVIIYFFIWEGQKGYALSLPYKENEWGNKFNNKYYIYIYINIYITLKCFLKLTSWNNEKLSSELDNNTRRLF